VVCSIGVCVGALGMGRGGMKAIEDGDLWGENGGGWGGWDGFEVRVLVMGSGSLEGKGKRWEW